MDWFALAKAVGLFAVLMYGVGFGLSLMISQLKCKKVSPTVSAQQGAIWMSLPTILFASSYYEPFRKHFDGALMSLTGAPPESAAWYGSLYLVFLGMAVTSSYVIHSTEVEVCVPSVSEQQQFTQQLMKELAAKKAATNPQTSTS
jgi:hypothetical protein